MCAIFTDHHFCGYLRFRGTKAHGNEQRNPWHSTNHAVSSQRGNAATPSMCLVLAARNVVEVKTILESYHPRIWPKFVNTLLHVSILAYILDIPCLRFSSHAISRFLHFVNDQSDAHQQDQLTLNDG